MKSTKTAFLLIIGYCSAFAMEHTPLTVNETLFLIASCSGTEKEIKAYIAAGVSINTEDKFGENGLFKAVYHHNWRVAHFLIENGINLNHHPHNHGNNTTYLHRLATENSSPENETAAYLLLDNTLNRGARPNPLDRHGDTPLDSAYYKKNNASIQLLKKAGGVKKVRAIEL